MPDAKLKVLFVCSAGLLRSPTAADMFRSDTIETRARGCETTDPQRGLTKEDGEWADMIISMEERLNPWIEGLTGKRPDMTLGIPDKFRRNHPTLKALLRTKLSGILCRT